MKTADPSTVETLRKSLAEQGVKYALASFVDIHGVSKTKVVPLAHLPQMLQGSELFTGAALDGVPQQVSDEEVAALPDAASCTVLPWNPEIAWFASDLWCRGEPFEACSRQILKRQTEAAAAMGLRMNLGVETEFFVLKEAADGRIVPVSERDTLEKPCYDLRGFLDSYGFLDEQIGRSVV